MNDIFTAALPYKQNSCLYFNQVRNLPFPVFLDSGASQNSNNARYDIISAAPCETLNTDQPKNLCNIESIKKKLHELTLKNPLKLPFIGGFIGFISYEHHNDNLKKANITEKQKLTPDIQAGLYHWAVITDHYLKATTLVINPFCSVDLKQKVISLLKPSPTLSESKLSNGFMLKQPFKADITKKQYTTKFNQIKQYLKSGDCYQINLAQRFQTEYIGDPWQAYLKLRKKSPSPYSAFLDLGEFQILCLSPEQFIGCKNQQVTTRPIKGTSPRNSDIETDTQLKNELHKSIKNRAENLMIVDLLRNDLGRLCQIGSIQVPKLFEIESYANVHHLVSTITGQLPPEISPVSLINEAFPGGSITGAPKIRAMEIINELEVHSRGPYCGSIFYFSLDGTTNSNISIRTLVCKNEKIYCWGGGGIVADSECGEEYAESITKVKHLMTALEDVI